MQNFLSILDFDPDSLTRCLDLAATLKRDRVHGRLAPTSRALNGRHVGLLFEKPSLRTRVTFTIGVRELGGDVVEIPAEVMHADREPIHDVARNLERWVDAVVIRTFAQERLVHIAEVTPRLHVINALSNEEHPCQALADMQTLVEQWGSLAGKRVAFVGDGNNVCTSLVHACMMLSIGVQVATPKGCELPEGVLDVDAIYTDVWTSMGQEVEYADRKKTFRRYQVNEAMMALAKPSALFMHCLPAHRGEEVSDEVIESKASVVFDQAENRLHAQKALLVQMLADAP